MLSFFPRDVLDEIWDLIESVSEGFLPTRKPQAEEIIPGEQAGFNPGRSTQNRIMCEKYLKHQ